MDIIDPRHEAHVDFLFRRVCTVLGTPGFELKPLRRRVRGKGKLRSFALGYTRLGEKNITVDLYTPRTMKPRKTDAILRVACHELAHHQEPPRLYRSWFKLVRKAHHPAFWKQYKKDVEKISKDEILGKYFVRAQFIASESGLDKSSPCD